MKKQKHQGLLISLNKPYETIYEELKESTLDENAIYCIDAVSKETGKFTNTEKCFCLDDPSSITELSLIINTLTKEGKINFIVLDSFLLILCHRLEYSSCSPT